MIGLSLAVVASVASADTLLYWTIPPRTVGSAGNTNGVTPANGDGVLGIAGTEITLLGSTDSGGTTSSDGWRWYDPSPRATSLEEALTQDNFFEWSVTTNGATTATINGLGSTSFRKGSSAPNTLGFLYSTDPSWATYRTISAATSIPGSTATDLAAGLEGDLSTDPITLTAGSTGYFRLAYWGATSVSSGAIWMGDAADGDDFSLLGTVASSTKTLTWNGVAGAPGSTWDTSPANTVWLDGATASGFSAFDNAVFAAATDVVVDAGGVSAGGVEVTHETGSVAIGGGSVTASSLTKTGGGTLVLAADNTFNTGATISGGTVQIESAGSLGSVAASFAGGTLVPAGVATVANDFLLGSGGLTVDTAGTTTLSGGITATVALDQTRLVKTGAGTLVLSGGLGVQNTGQLELDIAAGSVTFQGSQKNIGGTSDWNGDVTLDGALMMLHGGTVAGTGTITNANAASIIESRFNRGTVRVENALVLDESITIDSPNGDNLLQLAGDISGTGGLTVIGNGPKELLGSNAYAGVTSISENGTLTFGSRASLYGGTTASWTDTNLVVAGTAGAGFRVGGSGQFTAADLDVILPLGTATGGFLSGARAELDTADGDFAYSGSIADPNAGANQRLLVKQGANTLTLSGTNSYTGSTTVEAGTLTFAAPAALYGGNTASWTAANLQVEGGATAAFGVGGAGGFTAADIDQLAALTGFANNSLIGLDTTDAGGSFTYASVLADPVPGSQAIGLAKLGTGTLVLSGANTYTGGTVVAAGTLQLGDASALGAGSLTVSGGVVDLAGFSIAVDDFAGAAGSITNSAASAATVSVTVASGTSTFSGSLTDGTGPVSLSKTGSGDLRLSGSNSYSGGTETDGDIFIDQTDSLGSGTITSTGAGGRIYWEGVADTATVTNALNTGSDITRALAFVPGADRTVALTGAISGSGQIKISSSTSGVLDLTQQTAATNTNVGGVEIGSGRVLIDAGENLGSGNVNFGTSADSTLLVGGADVTVSNPVTLGGTTSTSAGTAIIDTNGNALTLSGGIDERTGNLPGSLEKIGLGTLTLSGPGAFQGTTLVSAGTLVVASADALQSTTGVTVTAGATLAGTGTVGAATAVAGIVAPGASIGTLSIAGDLTWSGAATAGSATDWLFELGPGNTADLLDVTAGSFLRDDATGTVYRFDFGGATDEGTYTLVNWSGSTDFTAGDFSYTNLGAGLTGSFSIDGSSLSFSAVPEPATLGAAVTAAVGLGVFLRRRAGRRS